MSVLFSLNLRALKSVAIAASTEETRYYLNGVNLVHTPSGVIMVATDGHRMMIVKQDWTDIVPNAEFKPTIVPLAFIKKIKLVRGLDLADCTIGNDGAISIKYAGETMGTQAVDGTFPDWRRIVPKTAPSNVPAHFNADYLADFAAAGRMLSNAKDARQPVISHDDGNPALVNWYFGAGQGLQAVGVLMPIRTPADLHRAAPAWALPEAPKPAPDAAAIGLAAVAKALEAVE
jgi:DNA polymerase-3 subunit beta